MKPISAASCAKCITLGIRITGVRRMRWRFALMSKLILLAAWVGGIDRIDLIDGRDP